MKTKKPQASKGDTYLKTLELIKQDKTLDEIATARDLTTNTVIGHLTKLKSMHPEISLKLYKPDAKILSQVRKAIAELSKNPANISDAGYVSAKKIFSKCGGAIDYPMIKLCGMFI